MTEESTKEILVRLLCNKETAAVEIADAIEALIHEKLAEAFNLMSKKIEDSGAETMK